MAACRRVYDSRHLQADGQVTGSVTYGLSIRATSNDFCMTLKVIRVMQDLSNAIRRTLDRHLTRFLLEYEMIEIRHKIR